MAAWKAGLLGNRPRVWETAREAHASGAKVVGFRQRDVAGGGRHDVVLRSQIHSTAAAWEEAARPYFIDEAAPDHRVQLQGEICRTTRGLEGILGVRTGVRMREAMARGLLQPTGGLKAKLLLDHFFDPASRDDLECLLERYPDAAIEFATYDVPVGVLPSRYVLIWEVRNY